jgi:hypothetical protein
MTLRRLWVLVWLIGFTATGRVFAAPPPQFKIVVNIENYAQVERSPLQAAKRETARLFRQMGIQIEWRDRWVQAPGDMSVPAFSVVMLSPSMAAEKTKRDGVASETLAISSQKTGRAYVFYDRLVNFSQQDELDEGLMLGYALVHELGHMIADLRHDGLGIMRKSLELRQSGFLGFTRAQKAMIRTALANAMKTSAPFFALRAVPDLAP